ncbi:MAG: rod shape-determining protein MreD [Candidatus Omnitrophota bacterium]
MKKILWILSGCIVLFFLEIIISNVFGHWLKPNLLILFIVFVNLYFGVRQGLFAAVVAGLLKDSFAVGIFGAHIFAFILSSYLVILIKRYVFHIEALALKLALAFTLSLLNVLILYFIQVLFTEVNFKDVLWVVAIPEVTMTTIVGPYCLESFKKCALRILK